MWTHRRRLLPLDDRGPLRAMFAITSMPVGGAETLLVDLIRGLDRRRFSPELCCLKELGPLGEELAQEIPAFSNLIAHKFDLGVLVRLTHLMRSRQVDALVTVGAGDKMFWGRLAAWRAGVPVIASALHSTGWPDGVGRLNRLLTPLTDAFVGVAREHGRHLVENERFPAAKVHVISNGVDTRRFRRQPEAAAALRRELGIPPRAPVCGIVAALRPEKNHELFLQAAAEVLPHRPLARFVIVGDGPRRQPLEKLAQELGIAQAVHFTGTRKDIPELLSLLDVFALTSHMEANPVSILEAMSTAVPVVSTRVGSIPESVAEGETGFLVEPGSVAQVADRLLTLLGNPQLQKQMGQAGRDRVVQRWSLEVMISGYENLLSGIYASKARAQAARRNPAAIGQSARAASR